MRFNDPIWLLAGLLTCSVLVSFYIRYDAWQRAAIAKFVALHLRQRLTGSLSGARRWLQRSLFVVSILCLFAALADPTFGYHWETISRRGNEVVFAIDTSRSMLTPDVKPDRLTRAKFAIDDMAKQLDGDGIGIVAFAGSSFLVCPLTIDFSAFQQSLDAVDVHTIPLGGTNIPSAIQAARAVFRGHPDSDRILILVTDGENLQGDALTAATEAAKQEGLKIYTVGVGTAEGDLIPLPPDQGGGFVKDDKETVVKSHLDENGLKAIAAATGGAYVHVGDQGDDFETFLHTVFGKVTKRDLVYRQQRIYTERYQWPLAASLGMLLLSLAMGTRRRRRRRAVARAVAASALIAVMINPTRSQSADQANPPGGPAAAKAPVLDYNAGTSAYRAGQFPQATQAFQRSIKTAPASDAKRLADQEDAYYNLGDALYRAGQPFEKSDPQKASQTWTEAVKAYDTALQLRANDTDSKYNRDFVQRKIDTLQQPPKNGGGGGQGKGNGQGQPPPPAQGQPPPRGQAPQAPQNPNTASKQQDQQAGASPQPDNERTPGQMSPEEARELLDSAKSDERHSLGVPAGPRNPDNPPDKAFKNW